MGICAGYLMPHPPMLIKAIGKGQEQTCHETLKAMDAVASRISEIKPKWILVITPHGPVFTDAIAIGGDPVLQGDFSAFGCPQVKIEKENSIHWVERILKSAKSFNIPMVQIDKKSARQYRITSDLDHGVMVPLHFIDQQWNDYQLIHLTYGLFSIPKLYEFGMLLKSVLEESPEPGVIIASGDLSHCLKETGPYKYHPAGEQFDQHIVTNLENGDLTSLLSLQGDAVEDAGECGYRSLAILGGLLDGKELHGEVLSYEGPFGVGYCVAELKVTGTADTQFPVLNGIYQNKMKENRLKEGPYVQLARHAVESAVLGKEPDALIDGLSGELTTLSGGIFVSIKSPAGLRGCIGTTMATTGCLGREIIANGYKAALEDPRFNPIEPEELDELTITVDVLGKAEPIESKDCLDPQRYGVIVTYDYKRGLLLPALEGIDTVEEQLRIVLQKAGISPADPYSMQRFEVVRHY